MRQIPRRQLRLERPLVLPNPPELDEHEEVEHEDDDAGQDLDHHLVEDVEHVPGQGVGERGRHWSPAFWYGSPKCKTVWLLV